jgi:hypothetical protein
MKKDTRRRVLVKQRRTSSDQAQQNCDSVIGPRSLSQVMDIFCIFENNQFVLTQLGCSHVDMSYYQGQSVLRFQPVEQFGVGTMRGSCKSMKIEESSSLD